MLEFTAQDLCAHLWRAVPCVNLLTREHWVTARCTRCGAEVGNQHNSSVINWDRLPKSGRVHGSASPAGDGEKETK